ncbi:hypothetical protein [Thermococcus piezophilus]|nr:hypothetical protein [Thermococcus piezophilus]
MVSMPLSVVCPSLFGDVDTCNLEKTLKNSISLTLQERGLNVTFTNLESSVEIPLAFVHPTRWILQ